MCCDELMEDCVQRLSTTCIPSTRLGYSVAVAVVRVPARQPQLDGLTGEGNVPVLQTHSARQQD